jgi:hypothetical protein
MFYLVVKIGLMISSILFWVLLIIYPMLVLYNFYKNKRWVYFGLLCIPLVIGLCSVFWAFYRYEIVGGICTIVYIMPFFICIFINIICGLVHLVSYLTPKACKRRGLLLKRSTSSNNTITAGGARIVDHDDNLK